MKLEIDECCGQPPIIDADREDGEWAIECERCNNYVVMWQSDHSIKDSFDIWNELAKN